MQEAAKILGITPEAVRQRLKRGTLAKEKAPDGTVYVLLYTDQDRHNVDLPRSHGHSNIEDGRSSEEGGLSAKGKTAISTSV